MPRKSERWGHRKIVCQAAIDEFRSHYRSFCHDQDADYSPGKENYHDGDELIMRCPHWRSVILPPLQIGLLLVILTFLEVFYLLRARAHTYIYITYFRYITKEMYP